MTDETVRAFRYFAGILTPCANVGARFYEQRLPKPIPLALWSPRDKRERRLRARHGKRGRRGARRVPPPAPMPAFAALSIVTHCYVGHRFGKDIGRALFPGAPVPHVEALLYLPEGERPTEQHGRDLKRAL